VSQAIRPSDELRTAAAPLIGEAPEFVRATELARRFAPGDAPILLVGPTGTGKDLLAQHIHEWSGRSGEMVDVNCAAIPESLVESTLFGHRRGAFSGAVEGSVGLLEHADGGTLFLDELCSLALGAQAKLLRVLETGVVRRVGETATRPARFRLVCAVQERLEGRVRAGTFRMDLLQRVGGIVISLPALAERGRDLVLLARHFAAERGCDLSSEAACRLALHTWPGNVRELKAAVGRACWLSRQTLLSVETVEEALGCGADLGVGQQASAGPAWLARVLAVCEAHGWHGGRAAEALGVHRTTLYRRLRSEGVSLRDFKWGNGGALIGRSG